MGSQPDWGPALAWKKAKDTPRPLAFHMCLSLFSLSRLHAWSQQHVAYSEALVSLRGFYWSDSLLLTPASYPYPIPTP